MAVAVAAEREGEGERSAARRHSSRLSPGHGLRAVAVLLALRVGYKLARAAGKLLCEPRVSPGSEEEPQLADEAPEGGEDDVSARDQWALCAEPAPEAPEGSKLMASEHLPISVYHFYEQFLSIEATCLQDHHKSTGQYNFRASRWKDDGGGRYSRTFDFMQPKKGVCSVNARCVQQQRFSVHAGGVFVLTTDMTMQHIPYADCFRVCSFWQAAPDATGLGCNVSIRVCVPFSKRCLVKGLICSTTFKDCQTFFTDFLAKVQNSISTELLPTAAAQAAAAEQLLGASPGAAGGGLLSPPPPLLLTPRPRSPVRSPFAAADAEVFVSTPLQAGGSAPQRKRSGPAGAPRGWLLGWGGGRHKQLQRQRTAGAAQAPGAPHPAGLEVPPTPSGLVGAAGGPPSPLRHAHARSASRCGTPHRHLSRAVSAKPSFALPIAELRIPNRPRPAEVIGTLQVILLLLVLLVQLVHLYEQRHLTAPPHRAHMCVSDHGGGAA